MKSKIQLSEQQEIEVIDFYCAPNSAREVERKYGVNLYQLNKLLNKYNIEAHTKDTCMKLRQQQMYKTNQEKYGVDNIFQAQETKDKIKNTVLQRYGTEYIGQNETAKQRATETFKKHYGVTRYTQTKEFKQFYKENADLFKEKEIITKKINGTACSSKPEKLFYDKLIAQYGKDDVVQQYKEARYPYHCDFYIKSKDLFIELNLHWTHGGHVFNDTNIDDINTVQLWKTKAETSSFYKIAIYVWTQLDKLKIETANKNNLNYIVYYNLNELGLS